MTANTDPLPVIEVAAAIIWRGGRFLAAQRPEHTPLEGFWEFPGGKLEAGESAAEALRRELGEELGIGVREAVFWQDLTHSYTDRGYTVRLHFFHVTKFTGEPCPRERQQLRWVTPTEALELEFLAADTLVLAQLGALRLIED